jgi:hypothetical protein
MRLAWRHRLVAAAAATVAAAFVVSTASADGTHASVTPAATGGFVYPAPGQHTGTGVLPAGARERRVPGTPGLRRGRRP